MLSKSPLHLLHRACQCADEVFADCVSGDLTPRQFIVMSTVAQTLGLSQSDVVGLTGIDRSTTAELVARLMKRGLLRREKSLSDKRAFILEVTPSGQDLLHAAAIAAREADDKILSRLSPDQRKRFIDMLAKLEVVTPPEKDAGTASQTK